MTQEKFFERYKYSIRTDKIGGGTFGTVYKAYDDVLNRTVAIKVSEIKVIDGKEFSLQNEFEALKGLKPHKNIANYQELHTFEMHNGIFDYAIMQYYKDGNLSAFIKANPKLEKEQIAIYLLEGIEHLHNNKVVHRDLKPSNVLIVKKGTEIIPKITDFGLSKKADPNAKSRFTNSFGGGTLMYSSPEQLKGKKLRFNTDLWSYGVIIYELFTGNKLFENIKSTNSLVDSDIEIIKQINSKDLTNCILELPEKWQAVGKACLERNLEKRVQNSEGIKRILKEGTLETKDVQEEDATILDIAESKEDVKNYIDKERQAKPKKKGNTTIKKNTKWLVYALLFLVIIGGFIGYNNSLTRIETPPPIDASKTIKNDLENKTEQENKDWENTKKRHTKASYTNYITDYPKGKYLKDAKNAISKIKQKDAKRQKEEERIDLENKTEQENKDWENTKKRHTKASYTNYITDYPKGKYLKDAKNAINKIKQKDAKRQKEEERIDLENKTEQENKDWENTKKRHTKASYTNYITDYPKGKYLKEAQYSLGYMYHYGYGVEKDYKEAVKWYRKAANQGHASGQYSLGYMYRNGYGVEKDYKEAVKWYRKAANQGHAYAQNGLGYMYRHGYGVEKDYKEAVKWYRKAANQGHASGQNQLGYMYHYGYGVEKDYKEAVKWYRKAANQGHASGQYSLGYMYRNGYGVEKDYKEAVKWYRKAANQGHAYAQNGLGYMYRHGYGVEKDYKEAVKWYRKAANQGHASGQYSLGYMYYSGYGVEKDYKEAVKWYRKAANQGHAYGQYNLGYMYHYGYGVEKDYKEAVKWYRKAANQGDAYGQYNLGCMYHYGYGVEKDYKEAVKWTRKAANQGDAYGQNSLGYMYRNGYGVEKDYKEAVKWYRKAANQGHASGQYNLGDMYYSGYGVEKDYKEAVKWYRKACNQGESIACDNLRRILEN